MQYAAARPTRRGKRLPRPARQSRPTTMPLTAPAAAPRTRRARHTWVLSILAAGLLAACSARPPAAHEPVPTPQRLAELERSRAQRPDDLLLLVELGTAYRAAGRPDDSWPVLERALSNAPLDPAATLQLALTYEALGEWLDARLLYRNYLTVGRSTSALAGARARLALLERIILSESLGEALQADRPLETAAADPSRILVLPFGYSGANPDLVPLARVLSEAIAGELVAGGVLSVPDDNRVRLLLARMEPTGDVELHEQAVLAGARVLGAGRVLRGRMIDVDADDIRLDAELVDALSGEVIGSFSEQVPMRAFTALAARAASTTRATLDLPTGPAATMSGTAPTQAHIWYGRGLLSEDRGDPAAAATQYARAVQLDPRLEAARGRLTEARAVSAAGATTIAQMARLARRELPGPLHAAHEVRRLVPTGMGDRDAVAEVLGNEGLGRELILEIIVQPAGL